MISLAPDTKTDLQELLRKEDVRFRAGILWAIGRLGPLARESIGAVLPAVAAALGDSDPQVRGLAVWALGEMGRADQLASRPELLCDKGAVDLYEDGYLRRTHVRNLTLRAFLSSSGDLRKLIPA